MSFSSTKNILAALKVNKSNNGLLSDITSLQNPKACSLNTSIGSNQDQQDDGTRFSVPTLTLKPPTPKEIKKLEELKNELQHSQKKTKDNAHDNQITMINIMEKEQEIIIAYITAKGKTAKIEIINKPNPGGSNAKAANSSPSFFSRKGNSLSLISKTGFFRSNNKPGLAATAKELLIELQNKFAHKGCIVRLIPLSKELHNENRKTPSPTPKNHSTNRTVELENTNTKTQEQQNTASSQHTISPTPFSMILMPRAA